MGGQDIAVRTAQGGLEEHDFAARTAELNATTTSRSRIPATAPEKTLRCSSLGVRRSAPLLLTPGSAFPSLGQKGDTEG